MSAQRMQQEFMRFDLVAVRIKPIFRQASINASGRYSTSVFRQAFRFTYVLVPAYQSKKKHGPEDNNI
jgi:hypothetical protein